SGLPKTLWGEALAHIVYVKNHSTSRVLNGKTSYELLYSKKPNIGNIPVWGTRVWVHDASGSKLDMRAKDGRWVGFDAESGGHRIYFEDQQTIGVE
ncbi:hypothetical protein PAXRUDRAFT_157079, partial [Paxillus rubicundulus Ve08.2h10]